MVFGANYLWSLSQAEFSVDRDSLAFSTVRRGDYRVTVRGTGVLVPDKILWLTSEVDASVSEVVYKAGNEVRKGDTIIKLVNPRLVQELAETQWEYEALEEELKAAQVELESDLISQENAVLDARLEYENNFLEYKARKEIVASGAVSKLEFQKSTMDKNQARQRWRTSEEIKKKLNENILAQKKAWVARLSLARKKVEIIQRQVDNLIVKAPMDSVILEVPLEAGQSLVAGENVAKLARKGTLITELQVPEVLISDVQVDQSVMIDTRKNKIKGSVSRIEPAVVGGNVQVDVILPEQLPVEARPELSVDGVIEITEIKDTLFLDRPLFAQSKSNAWLYRLTNDRQFAERVEVEVGYGSVNQIQVLSGLKVGDRVITSDPTRFETYEKFRLH